MSDDIASLFLSCYFMIFIRIHLDQRELLNSTISNWSSRHTILFQSWINRWCAIYFKLSRRRLALRRYWVDNLNNCELVFSLKISITITCWDVQMRSWHSSMNISLFIARNDIHIWMYNLVLLSKSSSICRILNWILSRFWVVKSLESFFAFLIWKIIVDMSESKISFSRFFFVLRIVIKMIISIPAWSYLHLIA